MNDTVILDHSIYLKGTLITSGTLQVSRHVQGVLFQLPLRPFIVGSDDFATQCGLTTRHEERFSHHKDDGTVLLPILLDIPLADFEAFLKVLIPLYVHSQRVHYYSQIWPRLSSPFDFESPSLSKTEWISTLKLSTLWSFKSLRATAIEHLSIFLTNTLSPCVQILIEFVLLARTYKSLHGCPSATKNAEALGYATAHELHGLALRRFHSQRKKKLILQPYDDDIRSVALFRAELNTLYYEDEEYALDKSNTQAPTIRDSPTTPPPTQGTFSLDRSGSDSDSDHESQPLFPALHRIRRPEIYRWNGGRLVHDPSFIVWSRTLHLKYRTNSHKLYLLYSHDLTKNLAKKSNRSPLKLYSLNLLGSNPPPQPLNSRPHSLIKTLSSPRSIPPLFILLHIPLHRRSHLLPSTFHKLRKRPRAYVPYSPVMPVGFQVFFTASQCGGYVVPKHFMSIPKHIPHRRGATSWKGAY
ncbi:hypothetical protein BKA70DRAFT_1439508 [Coprinopsis sp. MPI-PUGE-AT-0042]|nr:hypothetical protein BKA70DRAFT_1439508 [Coprinopsis sp. MPI-PUGE-AT-0042]